MKEYNRKNPFLASIKERYSLCKPGSDKETMHIVLDLAGSDMHYTVGDSVAIFPENDPALVKRTLDVIEATGNEIITDKRTQEKIKLVDYLTKKASITEYSKKFLTEVAKQNPHLEDVVNNSFKEYQATREVWDTLLENKAHFKHQEFCDLLMPLLPRFYSIASSKNHVGDEMHLTVAMVQYETNQQLRRGVGTHFLCNLAPLHEPIIPIYVQPHHGFTIPPEHDIPIIMVGPGTGVAPFRAFLQERSAHPATKNWLFFGERNRDLHFFYEEFWADLESKGLLRLHTAFSRDQEQKVYVQHLMEEHSEELFRWIDQGALFYVCGDASQMAEDVDATLHRIAERHGQMTPEEARAFIKKLRQEKRYLRDVY